MNLNVRSVGIERPPYGHLVVATLVAALAADIATTWYGLRAGLVELNPVVAGAIEAGGLGSLVLMSAAVLAWTAAGSWVVHARYGTEVPRAWTYPVIGVAIVNFGAALNNGLLILTAA